MNKIAIITNSTISMDDAIINDPNHFKVYLTATLDGVEYTDEDADFAGYMHMLVESKNQGQTSQPSTGAITELLNEVLKDYNQAIVITPSQHLSGTYQNYILATEELKDKVFIVDSRNMAMNENIIYYLVRDLINQGLDASEIYTKAQAFADTIVSYALPGSLLYLRRSGRVNMSRAIIGTILSVKLVIKVETEGADVAFKARGFKKLLQFYKEEIERYKPTHVVISDLLQSEENKQTLEKFFTSEGLEIRYTDHTSIVCGTHFGPESSGIAFYKEEK